MLKIDAKRCLDGESVQNGVKKAQIADPIVEQHISTFLWHQLVNIF